MVSNIFYFHPYLGKWSNLTNIFQLGWKHQLGKETHLPKLPLDGYIQVDAPRSHHWKRQGAPHPRWGAQKTCIKSSIFGSNWEVYYMIYDMCKRTWYSGLQNLFYVFESSFLQRKKKALSVLSVPKNCKAKWIFLLLTCLKDPCASSNMLETPVLWARQKACTDFLPCSWKGWHRQCVMYLQTFGH